VTGAASGIGLEVTKQLIGHGYIVYACDINKAALHQHYNNRNNVHIIHCDITDQQQLNNALDFIKNSITVQEQRKLHGIINAAGIMKLAPMIVQSEDEIEAMFNVNFFGTMKVIKTFFPLIQTQYQSNGVIMVVTSVLGRIGLPATGFYSATKHALQGYCDSLRREVRHLGVNVVMIDPSFTDTPLLKGGVISLEEWGKRKSYFQTEMINIKKAYHILEKLHLVLPPASVAKEILYAISMKSPPTRIVVGRFSVLYRILFLLPDKLVDWILSIVISKRIN